jgi:two-component system, chemotaxis family, protein-glutamate methylesterase/glutaminase
MDARKDIVVVGASAGGMDALQKLVGKLPADYPGSVFIVWHLSPGIRSMLPEVLTRSGPLPATHPKDGDPIEPGRIYVAPSDHHLLVERGYVRVKRGPKENRFRPAVDPLFRSAAYTYGARVVGVVLSGALDDGTSGLWTIKLRGGTAIVQDPSDASHRSMPLSALEYVQADHKLPAARIGALIGALAREAPLPEPVLAEEAGKRLDREVHIAAGREALEEGVLSLGEPSHFTCPECHGVLSRIREGRITRYRCHTGHAYSPQSLLNSSTTQTEDRLWDAVRLYDETVLLLNTMAEELANSGRTLAADRLFAKAREAHERSVPIREAAQATEKLGEAMEDEATQAAGGE